MSTIQPVYVTGTAVTITLASLANNSARQSNAIDNSSSLYAQGRFQLKLKSGASGTSNTGVVNIYVADSGDEGANYAGGATGSDSAITLDSPPNVTLIGTVNVVANATTYISPDFDIAAAFGGVMPQKFAIIVENRSGAALDATEGNFKKTFKGIYWQTV